MNFLMLPFLFIISATLALNTIVNVDSDAILTTTTALTDGYILKNSNCNTQSGAGTGKLNLLTGFDDQGVAKFYFSYSVSDQY